MKQLQSFFLGILGALGALFLEIIFLIFSTPIFSTAETITQKTTSIGLFFFLAILIEEFLKYILLYKSVAKTDKKNEIVLNSILFGFGFSILEMFFVFWNYQNEYTLDLIGLLGIITIHISTALLMGYSIAKNTTSCMSSFFFGFVPALIIHAAYNILRISEITRQKELIIVLLILLIFGDIFLLIKSKIAYSPKLI